MLTVNTTIDVRPLSINEGLYGFIYVSGTLEINGTGTIACGFNSLSPNAVLDVIYPGVLIVNDGITIKGGYGMGNEFHGIAVRNYSGTVTINGGEFWGNSGTVDGSTSAFFQEKSGYNSTIKGGTFNVTENDSKDSFGLSADNDKVTLSGGTYQGIEVTSEITIADLLAADYYYCHVDSNGTFDGTSVTETTQVLTVKTKRAVDVNITAPVAGAQPQPASSNSENTKVSSTVWSLDGTVIPDTGTFEAEKTYKVQVSVSPTYDYFFADALTVTINDSTAVPDFWRSGSAIIFEVEFTAGNTITVTDGKATVDGVEVNQAVADTEVTLIANDAPAGQVFDKWVVENGSITLADANSATTTFTMPAGEVIVKATYKTAPHTHSYGTEWKSDAEKHWHECDCGAKADEAAHIDENNDGKCDTCEYNMSVIHTHDHSTTWKSDENNHWHECECGDKADVASHTAGDWIIDTAVTATTEGTKHKECTVCGYVLENGTIPATGSGEHTHSYGSEWKANADKHWHECDCGAKNDEEAHSAGEWIINTEATATTEGAKHKECTVCGYVTEIDTIPATGGAEHTHSYGSEWKSDENNHWNECECGDKANVAPHVDENNDGKCDICDHAMGNADNPGGEIKPEKTGLSGGAIAGIVIGSVAVAGVGGFSLFWFVIKKKKFADLIALFKKK